MYYTYSFQATLIGNINKLMVGTSIANVKKLAGTSTQELEDSDAAIVLCVQ